MLGKVFMGLILAAACLSAQGVRITWIGQSCFVIETGEGKPVVITDPPVASVGYALPTIEADVVTVSHNHTDHNNTAGVRGSFTLVDGRTSASRRQMTAAGLNFALIPGFHDNQNGAVRGANTMVRWTQGGLEIAHLGDHGQDRLTEEQAADLRNLDILILPAGGFFTIDAAGAARLIDELKPKIAILMHYRTAFGGPAQLSLLPGVTAAFPGVRYKPARVTVKRESLPQATEVWVMQPWSDTVATPTAGYTAGAPVAPGAWATLFGNFPNVAETMATEVPLPQRLANTEVRVGDVAAPLSYVSSKQINFQVPVRQAPGQPAVEVQVNGERVGRAPLTVVPSAPGLFAVANQDGRINSASAPARRGEVIQIFGSGQGVTVPEVAEGAPAPGPPFASTAEAPAVYIHGRWADVLFHGLTPGAIGLWQINARVPAETPSDPSVPLVVVLGLASNELGLAVGP